MIENNKIKYILYNFDSLNKQIKDLESDIIDTGKTSVKSWLKSKHHFIGVPENQAIVLAESKELNNMRKLKKGILDSLEHLKSNYPFFYDYVILRYFEKNTTKQIEEKMNIGYEKQLECNEKAILLISQYLENK